MEVIDPAGTVLSREYFVVDEKVVGVGLKIRQENFKCKADVRLPVILEHVPNAHTGDFFNAGIFGVFQERSECIQ